MLPGHFWIYVRTTRPCDRVGGLGFWAYIALLSLIYVGSAFGPPPPSAQLVAWSAAALWIFPLWAAWIDRHRAQLQSAFSRAVDGPSIRGRSSARKQCRADWWLPG
jgi:hypothetical protein